MEATDKKLKVIPHDVWNYDTHLREYLLLLAKKGTFGYESIKNYPETIQLSQGWHKTLDKIRQESLNGFEYWAYVGFKDDRRTLWFPSQPAKGFEGNIPAMTISEEIQHAKDKFGIIDLIGDIHSHPRDLFERILQKTPVYPMGKLKAHFSVGDWYRLANTERFMPLMAVVEGEYNLVAFRTRETTGLNVSSAGFNQESFQRYWYDNNGFKYMTSKSDRDGENAIPISPLANFNTLTRKIMERHSLVLYQGKKDENLKKVYL